MRTRINKSVVGSIVLSILFLLSCSRGKVVFDYEPVPSGGWKASEALLLCPVIKDTLSLYDVFIEVRNDNRYPYQNLWLYVSGLQEADSIQTRPIEVLLADEFGKWNGKGFSFVYEVSVPYLQDVQFAHSGEYPVTIRHGMTDNPLTGLKDIGLRLVKREE